eukprot:gene5395-27157_t
MEEDFRALCSVHMRQIPQRGWIPEPAVPDDGACGLDGVSLAVSVVVDEVSVTLDLSRLPEGASVGLQLSDDVALLGCTAGVNGTEIEQTPPSRVEEMMQACTEPKVEMGTAKDASTFAEVDPRPAPLPAASKTATEPALIDRFDFLKPEQFSEPNAQQAIGMVLVEVNDEPLEPEPELE